MFVEDLLKLRDDYQSGDIEKRKSLEQAYGRKKILKMKDYFKSEKWLTMNAKMCPQCSSYFIASILQNNCNIFILYFKINDKIVRVLSTNFIFNRRFLDVTEFVA